MEFTVTDVVYHEMRVMVVDAIKGLADPEYQWRVWVRREYPHPDFFDDFTFTINMLDDLRMRDAPEDTVGDVLRNNREAQAIRSIADKLDILFGELGTELTDEEYLVAPGWAAVAEAAKAALAILTES